MGNISSCLCGENSVNVIQSQLEQKMEISKKTAVPYFSSHFLTERMNFIRAKYIEPIREEYSETVFYRNLEFFKEKLYNKNAKQTQNLLDFVEFSYWYDDFNAKQNFGIIRMTTHPEGHRLVTSLINSVLRNEEIEDTRIFQLCVFLIEAINIQLYLLTQKKPSLQNFQGVVYRGITVEKSDYTNFMKLNSEQFEKRYISVPLSLWSASKNFGIAYGFLDQNIMIQRENIIFKIHVVSLDPKDLQLYQQIIPTSVVSTICAVDISDPETTYIPYQSEVLLRGAFLSIISIRKIRARKLVPFTLLECVMVNANRDHISTSRLGQKADQARKMFGSMAHKARSDFAIKMMDNPVCPEKEKEEFQEAVADWKVKKGSSRGL